MVSHLPLFIKRMAYLAQDNTEVGQTGKTTAKHGRLPQVTLAIPAEALEHLKTRRHLQQLTAFQVKSFDLGGGKQGREVSNRCQGRLSTGSKEGNKLRGFLQPILQGRRLSKRVKLRH
jgi:hypothetical protein